MDISIYDIFCLSFLLQFVFEKQQSTVRQTDRHLMRVELSVVLLTPMLIHQRSTDGEMMLMVMNQVVLSLYFNPARNTD